MEVTSWAKFIHTFVCLFISYYGYKYILFVLVLS
jgi:hypothetical protein